MVVVVGDIDQEILVKLKKEYTPGMFYTYPHDHTIIIEYWNDEDFI
jgi:hypothetical protein